MVVVTVLQAAAAAVQSSLVPSSIRASSHVESKLKSRREIAISPGCGLFSGHVRSHFVKRGWEYGRVVVRAGVKEFGGDQQMRSALQSRVGNVGCVTFGPPEEMGNGFTKQGFGAGLWNENLSRGKSRRVVGSIGAMGKETMWITASGAVALVVALAAFAALGGFLLSMGVDNEERQEEEKIERLKEQGLFEQPQPTQYEEQGVGTRGRNRRISEE